MPATELQTKTVKGYAIQAGRRLAVLALGTIEITLGVECYIWSGVLLHWSVAAAVRLGLDPLDQTTVSTLQFVVAGCFFIHGAMVLLMGLADILREGFAALRGNE